MKKPVLLFLAFLIGLAPFYSYAAAEQQVENQVTTYLNGFTSWFNPLNVGRQAAQDFKNNIKLLKERISTQGVASLFDPGFLKEGFKTYWNHKGRMAGYFVYIWTLGYIIQRALLFQGRWKAYAKEIDRNSYVNFDPNERMSNVKLATAACASGLKNAIDAKRVGITEYPVPVVPEIVSRAKCIKFPIDPTKRIFAGAGNHKFDAVVVAQKDDLLMTVCHELGHVKDENFTFNKDFLWTQGKAICTLMIPCFQAFMLLPHPACMVIGMILLAVNFGMSHVIGYQRRLTEYTADLTACEMVINGLAEHKDDPAVAEYLYGRNPSAVAKEEVERFGKMMHGWEETLTGPERLYKFLYTELGGSTHPTAAQRWDAIQKRCKELGVDVAL